MHLFFPYFINVELLLQFYILLFQFFYLSSKKESTERDGHYIENYIWLSRFDEYTSSQLTRDVTFPG